MKYAYVHTSYELCGNKAIIITYLVHEFIYYIFLWGRVTQQEFKIKSLKAVLDLFNNSKSVNLARVNRVCSSINDTINKTSGVKGKKITSGHVQTVCLLTLKFKIEFNFRDQ